MLQSYIDQAKFWADMQRFALVEFVLIAPVVCIALFLIHGQLAQLNRRDEFRRMQEEREERNR